MDLFLGLFFFFIVMVNGIVSLISLSDFSLLAPIILKLFQEIAEGGTLPKSFYKATITLTPKPDKEP